MSQSRRSLVFKLPTQYSALGRKSGNLRFKVGTSKEDRILNAHDIEDIDNLDENYVQTSLNTLSYNTNKFSFRNSGFRFKNAAPHEFSSISCDDIEDVQSEHTLLDGQLTTFNEICREDNLEQNIQPSRRDTIETLTYEDCKCDDLNISESQEERTTGLDLQGVSSSPLLVHKPSFRLLCPSSLRSPIRIPPIVPSSNSSRVVPIIDPYAAHFYPIPYDNNPLSVKRVQRWRKRSNRQSDMSLSDLKSSKRNKGDIHKNTETAAKIISGWITKIQSDVQFSKMKHEQRDFPPYLKDGDRSDSSKTQNDTASHVCIIREDVAAGAEFALCKVHIVNNHECLDENLLLLGSRRGLLPRGSMLRLYKPLWKISFDGLGQVSVCLLFDLIPIDL